MERVDYDMSRLVSRHERVHGIREACSTEPALSAELDALFSRVRSAASAPTGSDPASDLVGGMKRVEAWGSHGAALCCDRVHACSWYRFPFRCAGLHARLAHANRGRALGKVSHNVALDQVDSRNGIFS